MGEKNLDRKKPGRAGEVEYVGKGILSNANDEIVRQRGGRGGEKKRKSES